MSEDQQPPWPEEQAKPVAVQPARQAQPESGVTRLPATRQPTTAETTYLTVVNTFKGNKGAEARALRAMLGGDEQLYQRFLATTFALLAKQSNVLRDATPASLVQAIKDAASMGLEPMTTDGGIVVYKGIATFMPQWQGYLKRIRNSRLVEDIDVQMVRDGDAFDWGWTEKGGWFTHNPLKRERGDTSDGYAYAYAYARMPSGFIELEVMTEAEVNYVRDTFARGIDKPDSPWVTRWSEMARKTVLRLLAKRLPGAAVDALLAADARAEAAEREAAQVSSAVRDELAEVRALALQAVGAGESSPEGEDASEAKDGAQA